MRIDHLEDENGDLLIENEDLVIGESDNDYINDIIVSGQGDYKETPLIGVFINKYLQSPFDISVIEKAIKEQLKSDGYLQAKVTKDAQNKLTVQAQ